MTRDRRWMLVALVAAVAVGVSALVALSQSSATGDEATAARGRRAADSRFTLVSGPLGDRRTGAFVIDEETMRLLVYGFDLNARQLKLLAVRDISQDVLLSHWNNLRPWPEDIRKLIEEGEAGEADKTDASGD